MIIFYRAKAAREIGPRAIADIGEIARRRIVSFAKRLGLMLAATFGAGLISLHLIRSFGQDFQIDFNFSAILAAAVGGLLSSLLIAVPTQALSDAGSQLWARIRQALDRRATPDAGYFAPRVELQIDKHVHRLGSGLISSGPEAC